MDLEGAEPEGPPARAPPSSHIASNIDATSSSLRHLYINHDDLLAPLSTAQTLSAEEHQVCKHEQKLLDNHNILTSRSSLRAIPLLANKSPVAEMSRNSASQGSQGSQQYQLISGESPADQARSLSQNNKDQLISSLRTHKINTITELRRIEKIFAYLDSEEVTQPMTSAWARYVNSNNLLNELRGLTKRIPFSSECLDEAKSLVVTDPASARSWNLCWLVLVKMEKENMITKYARALASKRSTWGNRQPTADDARKFITACVAEWTSALRQLLKHWDTAPSTTGT